MHDWLSGRGRNGRKGEPFTAAMAAIGGVCEGWRFADLPNACALLRPPLRRPLVKGQGREGRPDPAKEIVGDLIPASTRRQRQHPVEHLGCRGVATWVAAGI
jgi:hypothetical protein